ncbi:hypothetical protein K4L06_01820 [Lysobacter sp. BMK333-48F3]|uniref:hypothetical protein n=1 Tax=Lysobacter sp. BMK333-48F3 TaxID=2867962 RepID=UPI001C8CBAFE|nr:hypothetical protein [Lysobacter sp. BMK333-48F3]MBX9400031.1 hypothetical protein [Lysobacter sp. BMK333-48F3]
MTAERSGWRRLAAAYALAALALYFCVRYLGVQGAGFVEALRRLPPAHLALALAWFALGLGVNALGFALANRALSVVAPARVLAGAWLATLLAKYVPVGIGHVLGRGLVLSRYGVPARATAWVGLFEQAVSLGLCAAIALLAYAAGHAAGWPVGSALAISGGGVLLGAAWWLRRRTALRPMLWLAALACYAIAMLPYAAAYLVLVQPAEPLRFVQALFAGTVAGVLAVLVPGGLGVRESVVAAWSGAGAAETVLAGVVAARALILSAEVLASLVGQALLRTRSGPR